MSVASPGSRVPRWRLLLAPRWLGWHAFAVVAFTGMLWLGDWQFRRAEAGNALSWAYTFEWPVFAVFGAVFWARTVRDLLRPPADPGYAPEVDLPPGASSPAAAPGGGLDAGGAPEPEDDDPELAAYNAYLARLDEQARRASR